MIKSGQWWLTVRRRPDQSHMKPLRLGCDTFASDLNPVACLILKVLLEDIPRYGLNLAEDLRLVGADIKRSAVYEPLIFIRKTQ